MNDTASSALACCVLAATDKVVSQALQGRWSDVPQTVAQRRALLAELAARSGEASDPWLLALQQAVAESDAALQTMTPADAGSPTDNGDALHTALRQSLILGSITGS